MKTCTHSFTLYTHDVDVNERWRPGAIFLEMQDVSILHAEQLGMGRAMTLKQNLVFVLVRSRVEMSVYPRLGETVVSTTWPGKANRFFCPRYYTFTRPDGTPLGCASTLWVLIDVTTRQIASPIKARLPFPDTSDLLPPCPAPDKAVQLEDVPSEARAYTSVYTDIDINGHVNNTRYVDWLCDSLGTDTLTDASIASLVVNYEKEIRPGTALTLSLRREGERFSFLAADAHTRYCEIEGRLRAR